MFVYIHVFSGPHVPTQTGLFLLVITTNNQKNKELFGLLPLSLILPQCGWKGYSDLVQISCHGFSHIHCIKHPFHHSSSTGTTSTTMVVFFWFYLLLLNRGLAIKWIPPGYKYMPVTISIGYLTVFFLAGCYRDGSCRFLNDCYIAINCHRTEMFIWF